MDQMTCHGAYGRARSLSALCAGYVSFAKAHTSVSRVKCINYYSLYAMIFSGIFLYHTYITVAVPLCEST